MYEESYTLSIAPPESVGYNTPTQRKTQRSLVLDVLLCYYAYYV